jgi:hypothetical protein
MAAFPVVSPLIQPEEPADKIPRSFPPAQIKAWEEAIPSWSGSPSPAEYENGKLFLALGTAK